MHSLDLVLATLAALTHDSAPLPASTDHTALLAQPALPALVWSDFDSDGASDLLVVNEGGLRLLRGSRGGELRDCTLELGLLDLPPMAAAAFVDFDSDGRQDLFLLGRDGTARLLRNESGATFIDATLVSGLAAEGPFLRAEWRDVNGDGLADLTTWTPTELQVNRNLGGTFAQQRLRLMNAAGTLAGSGDEQEDVLTGAAKDAPLEGLSGVLGEGLVEERTRRAAGGDKQPPHGIPPPASAPAGPTLTSVAQRLPAPSIATQLPASCTRFVLDATTQACLAASSLPGLGQLYPLSLELNVHPSTKRVGMGTTSPQGKLHVVADPNETALRAKGAVAGFFEGRLDVGYEQNGVTATGVRLDLDANQAGTLRVLADNGQTTMRVLGEEAVGNGPQLDFFTYGGIGTVTLDAEQGSQGAALHLRSAAGVTTLIEDAEAAGRGAFSTWHMLDATATVSITAEETPGDGGRIDIDNHRGIATISLDGENGTGGGELSLYNSDGLKTIGMEADQTSGSGSVFELYNAQGVRTLYADAEVGKGRGSELFLTHANSIPTIFIDSDTSGRGGSMFYRAANGIVTVEIEAEEAAGDGGQIVLRKNDGTASIVLDAEQGGDGRITTELLEITGGADLVESFETSGPDCEPGAVVVIDPARPGGLRRSSSPYDTRVAGVVSGAGDVRPGLHLGQAGVLGGDTQVALTGRVLVLCSNENGAIRPGDLLTSSSTPGHAMRASEPERAFGAVLGKAMEPLEGKTGLVLVLVGLQ